MFRVGVRLDKLLTGRLLGVARGVIVLACGLAFQDVIDTIATADALSLDAAAAKARSMMLPGVIMQPSGVFATSVAQDHGCVYVRAT